MKRITRENLFKIAVMADEEKNTEAYKVAYDYHTKSCMIAKEKVAVREEDYRVIESYISKLDNFKLDSRCMLYPTQVLYAD